MRLAGRAALFWTIFEFRGNYSPNPCIMQDMELAQSKIPYLPPEWTVARLAKYAVKLGVFIVVPGLHQIACKRWILGCLIFLLYAVSEYARLNAPFDIVGPETIPILPTRNLPEVAQNISWLLLAFDLRGLERRHLKPGFLIFVIGMALLNYQPLHSHRIILFHVEQTDTVCPVFCKYDIIEWDFRPSGGEKLSVGDYVVVDDSYIGYYATKILSGPLKKYVPGTAKEVCAKYRLNSFSTPENCEEGINIPQDDYLTLGGQSPDFKNSDGSDVSMVFQAATHGVRPRKIGNLHGYFIISDEITHAVGNALLTIYRWSSINLFWRLGI